MYCAPNQNGQQNSFLNQQNQPGAAKNLKGEAQVQPPSDSSDDNGVQNGKLLL